jgi:hypothetical protein
MGSGFTTRQVCLISSGPIRHILTLKTDWFMLPGEYYRELFIRQGFKGRSYYNSAEQPDIDAYFDLELESAKHPAILHSIFDGAKTRGETWTRQDWLCVNCINSFLDRHKMNWWLDHKRSCQSPLLQQSFTYPFLLIVALVVGHTIPEDCWYVICWLWFFSMSLMRDRWGYNCRTQVHNFEHAGKLNVCRLF